MTTTPHGTPARVDELLGRQLAVHVNEARDQFVPVFNGVRAQHVHEVRYVLGGQTYNDP
jgi:hypothetical protein